MGGACLSGMVSIKSHQCSVLVILARADGNWSSQYLKDHSLSDVGNLVPQHLQ